jgi:hypothetical protein
MRTISCFFVSLSVQPCLPLPTASLRVLDAGVACGSGSDFMNVSEITAKAKVLLEALPYIQDFRGSTFVVKYGGSFMDDPDPVVRSRVAYDIAFFAACGINVVVVHGGGKAITRAMETSRPQGHLRQRHARHRRRDRCDRRADP